MIYEGDHFRTRLTHTLEVCQIARSIANALNLNEDLTEAIALGHDIGHTPFGHIGESILHEIMSGEEPLDKRLDTFNKNSEYIGGFKHNWQSIRVLDFLEKKYDKIDGINLTHDVREGILKHSGLTMKRKPNNVIYDDIPKKACLHLKNSNCTSLEGQIVKIADEIAQKTHDLEDGFRSGVVDYQDIDRVVIVEEARMKANSRKPKKRQDALPLSLIVRSLIHILIVDLIENSRMLISKWKSRYNIKSSDDFYDARSEIDKLIDFGTEINKKFKELANTINDHIINSERVNRMDGRAKKFIKDLFISYFDSPRHLPSYLLHRYEVFYGKKYLRRVPYKNVKDVVKEFQNDKYFVRMICDHIAGMTDKYALEEHQNLYLSSPTLKI